MFVIGAPPNCGGPGMPERAITSSRVIGGADDRRKLAGKDRWKQWQVSSAIAPCAEEIANSGLAFCQTV